MGIVYEEPLRLSEVLEKTKLKKSTVYSRIKKGEFPKSILIGGLAFWRKTDIQQWIDEQLAHRDSSA